MDWIEMPPMIFLQGMIGFMSLSYFRRLFSFSDAVLTTIDNEEDPKSQSTSNTSSKVQAVVQIVHESQGSAHGLNSQNLPGFVHLIS